MAFFGWAGARSREGKVVLYPTLCLFIVLYCSGGESCARRWCGLHLHTHLSPPKLLLVASPLEDVYEQCKPHCCVIWVCC